MLDLARTRTFFFLSSIYSENRDFPNRQRAALVSPLPEILRIFDAN